MGFRAAVGQMSTAAAKLEEVRGKMARDKPNAAAVEGIEQVLRTLAQCIERCSQTQSAFLDLNLEIAPLRRNEKETVDHRISAKMKDLGEVSRGIAEIQRLLTGSTTFDAEFDRVQRAAQGCRQAEARVHDLRSRIADVHPCTVTIIGGSD